MAVKKWRGKWVVDLVVDDKRLRRVSPVQTKRGARAYEEELRLASLATPTDGAKTSVESPSFAEFAPEWLTTYAVVNNKPSEQARKEVNLRVHLVPFFGKWRLDEITPHRVEAYKVDRLKAGKAHSTINRTLTVLQTLLRSAEEWGRLESVPRIRLLPESYDFDWLRPDEAASMLEAAHGLGLYWYTMFFLALRTGMRRGEIYGLHWSEVDFDARVVTVRYSLWQGQLGTPKSGKVRVIPMTADLVAIMMTWRDHSTGDVVFAGSDGALVRTAQGLANIKLSKALTEAGLRRVRFHDLRHSFASHLVLMGRSLKEVQVLMGHHSVTETERYAHIGDEQLASAINALDGLGVPEGV